MAAVAKAAGFIQLMQDIQNKVDYKTVDCVLDQAKYLRQG